MPALSPRMEPHRFSVPGDTLFDPVDLEAILNSRLVSAGNSDQDFEFELFLTSFPLRKTKKALHKIWEGPLTHQECLSIFITLERAARPSGCSEPGTLTRKVLCLAFSFIFSTVVCILRIYFPIYLSFLVFDFCFSLDKLILLQ